MHSSSLQDELSEIITYKSTATNHPVLAKQADYLYKSLSKRLNTEMIISSNIPSIFSSSQNTKHPKVLLQAHIDVVPAKDELFSLKSDQEKLFGRGVFDMKFAAACFLQLVKDLGADIDNYDFGILFTSDEEIGGENGVAAVLEKGISAEVCILPDGGYNWQIEESCNSVWIIKIIASGESAHGSRPWEGDNAVDKLLEVINSVKSFFTNEKYHNTLTVSQINGGCALNQVPESAWASLDMRFIDEHNYSQMRVRIEEIIHTSGLEIETIAHVGATKLNKEHPLVKNFISIVKEKSPVEFGFTHSLGSSDAHYFESRNIPTILMRPRGGGAHSDHEWIHKSDLDLYYEVLKEFIIKNAKIS